MPARRGTKRLAGGGSTTWCNMFRFPSDFPTIIPPDERKRLDDEMRPLYECLSLEIAKWKSDPVEERDLDELRDIYRCWCVNLIEKTRDLCIGWLHEHNPPVDEAGERRAVEQIREIGQRIIRHAVKEYDTGRHGMYAAENQVESARDLIRSLSTAAGESWVESLRDWTPSARPSDIISMRVALQKFAVSRTTLKRAIAEGKIKSHRLENSPKNAEHTFSEAELARQYESHGHII